jgi:hypothetical protein
MFSVVISISFLAAAGIAFADTTSYNTLPTNIVDTNTSIGSITLNGPGAGTVAGYMNGSSVSWYTGYGFSFTYPSGGTTTYNEINSFCVDPATFNGNATYKIESLQAYLNANPAMASKYEQVAWLMSQSMSGNLSAIAAQAATWQILFKNYTYLSDSNKDSRAYIQSLINSAQTNVNPGDFYIAVTTDNSPAQSQSYLFDIPGPGCSKLPEPSTMFLLGTGMIGLAGYGARKKSKH